MNLKPSLMPRIASWATLGALTLAGTSAFAVNTGGLQRADVVADTRAARTAGLLAPAGELGAPAGVPVTGRSTRSRADLVAEVLVARRTGQLLAAGEARELTGDAPVAGSLRTRAAVHAEVLEARVSGDLVPAGEGPNAEGAPHRAAAVLTRLAQRDTASLTASTR